MNPRASLKNQTTRTYGNIFSAERMGDGKTWDSRPRVNNPARRTGH